MLARTLSVAIAAVLFACADLGPKNVEYEPNQVRFDWIANRDVPLHVRGSFQERFERNVGLLTAKLQDPVVVDALRHSNRETHGIRFSEIQDRDRQWRSGEASAAWYATLLDPACGRKLKRLQRENPSFAEIFVTNDKGMNVCETNRTTDYYQADEDWWKAAFNSGAPSHGELEFDESADTLAVAMYVPVIDPETAQILGVGKAVMRRAVDEAP